MARLQGRDRTGGVKQDRYVLTVNDVSYEKDNGSLAAVSQTQHNCESFASCHLPVLTDTHTHPRKVQNQTS